MLEAGRLHPEEESGQEVEWEEAQAHRAAVLNTGDSDPNCAAWSRTHQQTT